jgi:hypothetical protein
MLTAFIWLCVYTAVVSSLNGFIDSMKPKKKSLLVKGHKKAA